ncbi:hypothetical protein [Mesorhizobium sp. SP-1A]|uniref:hypothetical protein n=1 Tax=Mesorhizobium sp. SP-1A TaxID=3077840 RepID=UPI0028F70C54|nr:hypothetical protein [Mesorhizobium sp. SP-1A]
MSAKSFKGRKALSAQPSPRSADAFGLGRGDRFFHRAFSLEDGPMFDPCNIPGCRGLHERRVATWALLIGETFCPGAPAETRRRPHRGMLPDVDFSGVVPHGSRPSLVRRLFDLFRPHGGRKRPEGERQETSDLSVGEKRPTTYIGRGRQPVDSGWRKKRVARMRGTSVRPDSTASKA